MPVCSLWVDHVMDKRDGRVRALRQFVQTHPRFLEEFHYSGDGKYAELSIAKGFRNLNRYFAGMDKYIEKKGFKVIDEKPYLRWHGESYYVEVVYDIQWD